MFAAITRLIPHWPNFTPIAAIALFGGATLEKKYLAFIIPLIALFISDLIIGLYPAMPAIYISFIITVLIGIYISKNVKAHNILLASLTSSIIFFIITNFAAWIGNPLYPNNITGLIESYIAGLAFFNDGKYGISMFLNEVISGLFFNALLFGIYYITKLYFPSIAAKSNRQNSYI